MQEDAWDFPELELELRVHPRYICDPETLAMVDLWVMTKSYPGALPDSGGLLDQSSYVLAAFDVIEWTVERLRPKRKGSKT